MRVLHISDLHLKAQGDFNQDLIVERFIDDAGKCQEDRAFDAVIFSGDLSSTGKPEEFARVTETVLTPLLDRLALDRSQLVLVPGNHDIDREKVRAFIEPGLRHILVDTPSVDALTENPEEYGIATSRLDAWNRFFHGVSDLDSISEFDGHATVHTAPSWARELAIVGLNSAWRATGAAEDGDRGSLLISESHAVRSLDQIEHAAIRIAVMHHPLDWLENWNHSVLRTELERRNLIVLSGHEHVADVRWSTTSRGSALYLPTASLYQGDRRLPISYSIIDIDRRNQEVTLNIRSWMEGRGLFDRALEYLPNGAITLPIPAVASPRSLLLPKYTAVTQSLTAHALLQNSFLDLLPNETAPNDVTDIVIKPRLFSAPFNQIAASVVLARSQDKSISNLTTVDLGADLDDNVVGVLSGDALSGVTSALVWLLRERYSRDATRAPVYLKFRRSPGRHGFENLVREAARSFAIQVGATDALPPLVLAIDDVVTESGRDIAALVKYINDHPENRYIIGCHDSDGTSMVRLLEEAGIKSRHGYLGPFGASELRELIRSIGGEEAAVEIHQVLKLMFGENLPRSPFVMGAIVAVLIATPTVRPQNESQILEAVINLLLGKFDPGDTEEGLDARGRERLLQEFAKDLTISGRERVARREAEMFIAKYFDDRGIEGSASPGNLLNAFIGRRILAEHSNGVGFRHRPFQDVVAATLMRVNPEFASEMLANPPRYTEVIRHAAWLGRDDSDLLARVGEATRASVEGVITRTVSVFNQLIGHGVNQFDEVQVDALIRAATPPSPKEKEQALDAHYEFREVRDAVESPVELSAITQDAIGATGFLSSVVAASELVDRVDLKAVLLKRSIKGWNAAAEELGQQGHEWSEIRPIFEEVFRDVPDEYQAAAWQFFMRTSLVIYFAFGSTEMLAVPGLSGAIRQLDDDQEIQASPALDLMLTLLWVQLRLDGYSERVGATFRRHKNHLLVTDLIKAVAMSQYLSAQTRPRDVAVLERLLLDAMVPPGSARGPSAVQQRSTERSRLQTKLRNERMGRRSVEHVGFVDEIVGLGGEDAKGD